MSKNGMWPGDAESAGEGQIEATAHTPAPDDRTGGSRKFRNRPHQALSHLCKL
jgi:hypothetical protein